MATNSGLSHILMHCLLRYSIAQNPLGFYWLCSSFNIHLGAVSPVEYIFRAMYSKMSLFRNGSSAKHLLYQNIETRGAYSCLWCVNNFPEINVFKAPIWGSWDFSDTFSLCGLEHVQSQIRKYLRNCTVHQKDGRLLVSRHQTLHSTFALRSRRHVCSD